MIILSNTTDKVQVFLTSAVTTTELSCFVSYRDTTSTSITPIRNVTLTNGVASVDLVGSPASSTQRIVDYLSIYNTDTSIAEVTVRFVDNVTYYKLCVIRLAPGEKIEYQDGEGFKVVSNGYAIKTVTTYDGSTTESGFNMLKLNSDVIGNGGSATAGFRLPLTNLAIPVKSLSVLYFRFFLLYNSNATTTGAAFQINGPTPDFISTSQTFTSYQVEYTATSTSIAILLGNNTYNAGAVTATTAATSGNTAVIEGFVKTRIDGLLVPDLLVEVGAGQSITVKAGSFVQYQNVT
jgi:hypothetical protein